jgi:hypothetical protein
VIAFPATQNTRTPIFSFCSLGSPQGIQRAFGGSTQLRVSRLCRSRSYRALSAALGGLVTPLGQPVNRYILFPGDHLQAFSPEQSLHHAKFSYCRKALRPTGYGPAVVSVMSARRRGRSLRHPWHRCRTVPAVHLLFSFARKRALRTVSGNRAPTQSMPDAGARKHNQLATAANNLGISSYSHSIVPGGFDVMS